MDDCVKNLKHTILKYYPWARHPEAWLVITETGYKLPDDFYQKVAEDSQQEWYKQAMKDYTELIDLSQSAKNFLNRKDTSK